MSLKATLVSTKSIHFQLRAVIEKKIKNTFLLFSNRILTLRRIHYKMCMRFNLIVNEFLYKYTEINDDCLYIGLSIVNFANSMKTNYTCRFLKFNVNENI